MFEYEHLRKKKPSDKRRGFPGWLKGYAKFLYNEKGLQRMQVQGVLYANTGFDVSKHTLRNWLYVPEAGEGKRDDL